MRRAILSTAAFAAAVFMLANAAPAFAEYGAFARDAATGKYGFSANEANQKQAEDAAIKSCNTTGCKVAFRFGAKKCAAVATTDDGKAWGGAERPTRADAELHALQNCQKQTKVQCTVRAGQCNR
jgi:hypothetical protein